ncbi:dCTP deaminase domain-containing protein [Methylobacterium fujisawaense]|uniref:dCTP deaminase domain-containing protein n=1 Tax=Methylobacterium fujisawaense TaxID=107400 RepID=UPI00244A185D|nr:dUTP diphosphatase [Methylobacterium fujisawaense]MDH3030147.1 dUTP diphosphatase [Methylobacterium fujisawaense]
MCNGWSDGLKVEFKVLDDRLRCWGFPAWSSEWAAGLDLFACLDGPIAINEQAAPIMVSTGMAFRIGDPSWCALVVPRSGAGHRGLIHGNSVGVVDPDFDGPCRVSLWNRNPAGGSASPIIVNPGDRIGQLVFTRITRPAMVEVVAFTSGSARGTRGYGSSGP